MGQSGRYLLSIINYYLITLILSLSTKSKSSAAMAGASGRRFLVAMP
jgi:hypothetical protein